EKIVAQVTDRSGNGFISACITLLVTGQATTNGAKKCADVTARIDETLPQSGVYTVLLQEGSTATMPYSLALERIDPSGPPCAPIFFGSTVQASIEIGGDLDCYIFNAKSGDRISVQVTDQSGNGFISACMTLFGPDGQPTASGARRCADVTARIDET